MLVCALLARFCFANGKHSSCKIRFVLCKRSSMIARASYDWVHCYKTVHCVFTSDTNCVFRNSRKFQSTLFRKFVPKIKMWQLWVKVAKKWVRLFRLAIIASKLLKRVSSVETEEKTAETSERSFLGSLVWTHLSTEQSRFYKMRQSAAADRTRRLFYKSPKSATLWQFPMRTTFQTPLSQNMHSSATVQVSRKIFSPPSSGKQGQRKRKHRVR